MRALAELDFEARYAAKRRTYRMPEGTTVNELWLRAKVGKGRERPIDIPDEVQAFLADPQGQPTGDVLTWDFVLGPDAHVVFVDHKPPEGSEQKQ